MQIKKKLNKLYEDVYDVTRSKMAQRRRIRQFKKATPKCVLTAEQIAEIKAFYKPYKIPSIAFHNYFTQKTHGDFFVNYMPVDLYVGYIDPYFNNLREADYLDNKCYFGNLFPGIPMPKLLLKRMNGVWTDDKGCVVSKEHIKDIFQGEKGVFVKKAADTSGGFGVTYIEESPDAAEKALAALANIEGDALIQREIYQHEDLAKLNASSVNTIRLFSVLHRDGSVKVYSSVLRMGVGDTKVDNYSSGGISCGIQENGCLRKYGFNKKGERSESHPCSHVVFEGYQVPSYDKAVALVKKAHPMVAHFRMVSWDIAILENGDPILIEANLCRGGVDLLQLNNGPLFGEDTTKILDEVFHKEQN